MIRTIDAQGILNQSFGAEKVSRTGDQGMDQNSVRFALQLQQARDAARSKVKSSPDARKVSDRERKNRGSKKDGKHSDFDHGEEEASQETAHKGVACLLDILV